MVKKGDNGSRPTSLADLYGSVWIGAGEVRPAHARLGRRPHRRDDPPQDPSRRGRPLQAHPRPLGRAHRDLAPDQPRRHGPGLGHRGIPAEAAASSIAEKEDPSKAEIEKARRRLDRLVTTGQLHRVKGTKAGSDSGQAASWVFVSESPLHGLVQSDHETNHDRDRSEPSTNRSREGSRKTTFPQVRAITEPDTGITDRPITIPTLL